MNIDNIKKTLAELEKSRPLIHPLAENACIMAEQDLISFSDLYWDARMGADFMELFARKHYSPESGNFAVGVELVRVSDLLRDLAAEVVSLVDLHKNPPYIGIIYLPGDRDPEHYGLVACAEYQDPTDFWEHAAKCLHY